MYAGSREIEVQDTTKGLHFPALVLYPTLTPSRPTAVGPYSMDLSPGEPAAEGRFPLVEISHGSGGSHLLHRDVALELAKNGYIVALPEHPRNNRTDNRLENAYENLVDRPRHLGLAADAVYAHSLLGDRTEPQTVAVIGHSMGSIKNPVDKIRGVIPR